MSDSRFHINWPHNRKWLLFLLTCCCLAAIAFQSPTKKGKLTLHFVNMANGNPIVLADSVYTTPLGEKYNVTKLRYYISNIRLAENAAFQNEENYYLIDVAKETGFTLNIKEGKYSEMKFLLGVDSLRNFSGAQTGALDPMNDMFWTWNSGYVMFKLEGYSDSSSATNNKLEHHVGGYRFGNQVATPIVLSFDEFKIKEGQSVDIYINMNLDAYWSGVSQIRIAEDPVCTLPGTLAKKIAANFRGLFSIKEIRQ